MPNTNYGRISLGALEAKPGKKTSLVEGRLDTTVTHYCLLKYKVAKRQDGLKLAD